MIAEIKPLVYIFEQKQEVQIWTSAHHSPLGPLERGEGGR